MTDRKFHTPLVVLVCGTTILLLSFGLRQNLGLYMWPMSSDLGWGREALSFAIALQSLIWGIATPLMGFLADRFGPAKVVAAGGLLYSCGLYILSNASYPVDATIGIGVFTGFALSMTSFPIILSVIGRRYPPLKRSLILGIATAGGSSGQLFLVPLGHWLIDDIGWVQSLIFLAILSAIIVPLSVAMVGGNRRADDDYANQTFSDAMLEARTHSGYILLTTGYFVCGFQTMFISAHLPAYLTDLGQPSWTGAMALTLIGGFNVIGCVLWGKWGDTKSKKNLLALLYCLRAIVMIGFILMPITPTSLIIFSSLLGMLWLGTVPLTTGVVVQIFGMQYMATLVGFTFVSHQIGSFLGIWLGGVVYDLTGNYDYIFWGGAVLGLIAAIIHVPLDDKPLARIASAAIRPAH